MHFKSQLPIDALLQEIRQSLRHQTRIILQAPPGAGKTTRVPLALLDEEWLRGKTILMLEPRRLAASNAAVFMATQLDEPVGVTVGYTIRFQRKTSVNTRIEVVTEGVLTRRLQQDPELSGVGLVIFDEFHERHLQSDLALALCCDVQQGLRNDLRLLVMSATLDGGPLAALLDAPLLTSEGRSFPVEMRYLSGDGRRLDETTAQGIRRATQEARGDVLAFLPGENEILRCRKHLAGLEDRLDIRPLYGNLPFAEQERAILPGPRRKLVLATNIAETSLTIEGISVVVDSGYCRRPGFDSSSGLTRLELCRISQASAAQRAGRAGRMGPGTCYRLWSEGTQGALLPFTPPEIRSADLAPLALELFNWGVMQPEQLTWLDPPPMAAWRAALDLLQLLGAATPQQQLTERGRQLAALPVHPRLGCLLLRAQQLNLLPLACDLVALLSESDPWQKTQQLAPRSRSDLLDRLEGYWNRRSNGRLGEFQPVDRTARYWRAFFRLGTKVPIPGELAHSEIADLLLSAYPDRLGKRRAENSSRYQLSSGQGAQLAAQSALQQEDYLVAVGLYAVGQAEPQITLANAIDRSQLNSRYPNLPWQRWVAWDPDQERVLSVARQQFGALILAEKSIRPEPQELQQAILGALREQGLQMLNFTRETAGFVARVKFLQRNFPDDGWPDFSPDILLQSLEDWLLPFLGTARSRADLQKIDLLVALRSRFDWQQLQRLEELAPERYRVPSGSQIRLQYPPDGQPVLAVKLQELFGEVGTPSIAGGRCPLCIHLLSPAGRPLQITQDLKHFWINSYPDIRKEMKGRYPKHPWPDDPLTALPTAKTKRNLPNKEPTKK